MRYILFLVSLFSLAKTAFNLEIKCNSTSPICLSGGSGSHEGDVFMQGKPICDDNWDAVAADVVCKELGFFRAKSATWKSKFGTIHQANYSMDDVRCKGDEDNITDCFFTTNDNCGEGEAAGVICDTRSKQNIEDIERECFSYNVTHAFSSFSPMLISPPTHASSAIHCQELCQNEMSCERFTFVAVHHICHLLQRDGSLEDEDMIKVESAISGPQKCNVPDSSKVHQGDDCNRPNKVCLKGGKDSNEGNVFMGGRPVCDDGWNIFTANIVCKELGYSRVLKATRRSHFGQVSGNFSMDNVVCSGKEKRISNCTHSTEDDCDGLEGAGVICDTTSAEDIKREEQKITVACFVENYSVAISYEESSADGLHLVGGTTSAEGNVFIGDQPVCDDRWHFVDAQVTCRQLGFQGAKESKKGSYFGRVPSNFSMDEIECRGNEKRLQDCRHHNISDCGPSEGAGVVCDDRLIFTLANSALECQALCSLHGSCSQFSFEQDTSKCYTGNSTSKYSKPGMVMGPPNCEVNPVSIFGEDEDIFDNCTHDEVICLRGGSGIHEGNVFFGGKPICDDDWSTIDANVICQQFGYFRAIKATTNSKFGTVPKNFALNNVNCTGTENNITDCHHNKTNNCHIGEAAGVICDTGNYTLNLRGGSGGHEGNVFLGDSPVCDDHWDSMDAAVVCKQLGFEGYIKETKQSFYGDTGISSFVMDNVQCNGSESSLSKCIHRSKDDCDSDEGAGVICDQRSKSEIDEELKTIEKCFTKGVTYSKEFIIDINITNKSITPCHEHCRTVDNCTHFSYLAGICTTFSSGDLKINASTSTISGPRICFIPELKSCPAGQTVCLSGPFPNEGHVVVNGRPVCDDGWNTVNGHVVCKQLGYHKVSAVTTKSKYGKVSSNYSMDDVDCLGNETSIEDCNHTSENNCDAGEAAGVVCDTRSFEDIKAEEIRIENECFVQNVSYNVTTRFSRVALSPMDCQERCMSRTECTHFTFEIESKKCKTYSPGCRSMTGPEITELLQLGSTIVRGEDWKWGDQDGGEGGRGVIASLYSSSGSGWVRVRWGNDITNSYRMGKEGKYDLKFDCSVSGLEFNNEQYLGNHKMVEMGSVSGPVNCFGPQRLLVSVEENNTECTPAGKVCFMRQTSGANSHEGNVFVSGKPVCDDGWSMEDANVVCKQLGYVKALRHTIESFFGHVKASYGMDGVNCTGGENNITLCAHHVEDDCDGGEAAGVTCDYRTVSEIAAEDEKIRTCFVENLSYNQTEAFKIIEDVLTVSACQQHLCENSSHFSFSQQLEKCFLYQEVPTVKIMELGIISGPKICQDFNESQIYASNSSIDCNGNMTVCLGGGSNPREGNVFVGGMPVCDDLWTFKEANLVCRQLGYFQAKNYTRKSLFGQVSAEFAMDNVNCYGQEETLAACNHTLNDNCDGLEAAGVICDTVNETEYRKEEIKRLETCYSKNVSFFPHTDESSGNYLHLVGGEGPHEGNVFIGSKPVCDDSWDDHEAGIVCNQLGLQFVKKTRQSQFGEVPSDFAMDNIDCSGIEDRLQDCKYDRDDNCGSSEGAGVVCEGSPPNKTEVSSVLACQRHCEQLPSCKEFSFNNQSHACYLSENSHQGIYSKEGIISGPKFCLYEDNYEYYDYKYDDWNFLENHTFCEDFPQCGHNIPYGSLLPIDFLNSTDTKKNLTNFTDNNSTVSEPQVLKVEESSGQVGGIVGGVVVTVVVLVLAAAVLYKFKGRKTGPDTSKLVVDRVVYKDSSYVHMDQINYNEESNPGFGVINEAAS